MWELSRHLPALCCWEDPCPHLELPSPTRRYPSRVPVWLQTIPWHYWYDLCCTANPGEVQRTNNIMQRLFMAFINLSKAFDSVNCSTLLYVCEAWVTYWSHLKKIEPLPPMLPAEDPVHQMGQLLYQHFCSKLHQYWGTDHEIPTSLNWPLCTNGGQFYPKANFLLPVEPWQEILGSVSRTSWKCTSREETLTQQPGKYRPKRSEWRITVRQAVTHFEEDHLEQESARRLRRKARAQQPGCATLPETNICHICGRAYRTNQID